MIIYLNGHFISDHEARISLMDGGYLFGDGVFETLRLYAGTPFDLDGHLRRMARQLEALEYEWRPDLAEFERILAELTERNGWRGADARCRITVSRGTDDDDILPLRGHEALTPTVSVMGQPLGERLARWQRDGITVEPMPDAYIRGSFPHLKTLNYLPTAMALRSAARAGCDEALFVDGSGRVLEAATSNVFIVREGVLWTPPLDLGLLAGRTRALVLDRAVRAGLTVHEASFSLEELREADEVFLSGSVKEVVPVRLVGGEAVAGGEPGPVTRLLQKEYRRGVRDALGG